MPDWPLVTVILAVHDGEPYVDVAVRSVLRQTMSDLELVVVDDASSDRTPELLDSIEDHRLQVIRNDARLGLAGSLNRGLDLARGRYVARMDADDAAFPYWLERCLRAISERSGIGIVGAGVLDMDQHGQPRKVHLHDRGRAAFRWTSLFTSPAFHDTVVLDRELLERQGLRYDDAFGESEDYELWTRLLAVCEGNSVEEPLVLHRLHPEQASRRRGELQQSLAREVSLRQIEAMAPGFGERRAALARAVGTGRGVAAVEVAEASVAYEQLLERFAEAAGYPAGELQVVRHSAARALGRLAASAEGSERIGVLRRAAMLDPAMPGRVAARRAKRRTIAREARHQARELLTALGAHPIRVAAVFPEPTPYRTPLLDRVAALDDIDLTVVYAAESVVAGRSWSSERKHESVVLRGLRLPGGQRVFRHDYPVTPGIARALRQVRPDVVVVSGWSTFAAQAAIAWCRLRAVPYVLVVESHDEGPRAGWRKKVKGAVVPPIVREAAGVLVTGSLARASMTERGAAPERVRVFANTVDVEAFGERADRLAKRRPELREGLGASDEDVVVLSVARLGPEKRLDLLIRAVAAAGDERLLLAVAGEGLERARLRDLAMELGVRLILTGDVVWERIVELYVSADVFALSSDRETWGVVVNEAAACGLPLVLSDRVGAAHDLLRDGENGALIPAGDVEAMADALRDLAADPDLRRSMGARSRELARDWGYGTSVDGFLEAVREAVADHR